MKKQKMTNKGFTLIELLAVIVILAIILIIAVPKISSIIENVRIETFRNTAYGIIDASKYFAVSEGDQDKKFIYTNGVESTNPQGEKKLKYSGKKPKSGVVILNKTGKIALAIYNGKHCATKSSKDKEVTVSKKTSGNCKSNNYINSIDLLSNITWEQLASEYGVAVNDLFLANGQSPSTSLLPGELPEVIIPIKAGDDMGDNNNTPPTPPEATKADCFLFMPETNAITGYSPFDESCPKDIVIPLKIEGVSVKTIGAGAFAPAQLTSVYIPEGITKIEDGAFFGNNLTSISIPSSVTSIGDSSFMNNQLTEIHLSDNIVSIGESAFFNNKLISITLPGNITSISDNAFGSNKLKNVALPNSIINIGRGAFAQNEINTLTLPNNITSLDEEVFSVNQITAVTLPASLMSIGDSAFNTNPITSVIVQGLNVERFSDNWIIIGFPAHLNPRN